MSFPTQMDKFWNTGPPCDVAARRRPVGARATVCARGVGRLHDGGGQHRAGGAAAGRLPARSRGGRRGRTARGRGGRTVAHVDAAADHLPHTPGQSDGLAGTGGVVTVTSGQGGRAAGRGPLILLVCVSTDTAGLCPRVSTDTADAC